MSPTDIKRYRTGRPAPGMQSPTYRAHCATFKLARAMCGEAGLVTHGRVNDLQPCYSLRLLPAYRTPAVHQFRATVAAAMRANRNQTKTGA